MYMYIPCMFFTLRVDVQSITMLIIFEISPYIFTLYVITTSSFFEEKKIYYHA